MNFLHKCPSLSSSHFWLVLSLTLGVAVEDETVGGTAGDARDDVGGSQLDDAVAESLGAGEALKTSEVSGKASHVRRGHGGTGERAGAATGKGGEDVGARGKDVDKRAVVGEAGARVGGGGGTNGAGGRLGSRGVVGGVRVIVSGRDGEEDVVVDHGGGGAVESSRVATSQGHVGDDTIGAVPPAGVTGDEVDTGNDAGVAAGALVVQNLDAVEPGVLGDTVGVGADGSSNVGAVSLSVAVDTSGVVGDQLSAATEVRVAGVDARVEDVRAGAGTGRVVVAVGASTTAAGRDAGQTPWGTRLSGVGVEGDDAVLLDEVDLEVTGQQE